MTEKDFTALWIEKLRKELKSFPSDFVKEWESITVTLPGKTLFLPSPLFNTYQLIDEGGETFYTSDEHFKAKFVIYANRLKPLSILIPAEDLHVYEAVRDYEKYLDKILKDMEADFKQYFPVSKSFKRISAQIFNTLNLTRH